MEPKPKPKPKLVLEPVPTPESKPGPKPKLKPEPMPPPQSYAATAALHVPQQQRQALPRRKPSTRKGKPAVNSFDPVQIVIKLKNYPTLPIQALSAPEFFCQLTELCAKVPGAPAPLGVHWNQKDNLIISFPAGTTQTTIKLLFPTICLLVGTDNKPIIRFNIPWRKLHLAGICARNGPNLPIALEEELWQTLLLNPALRLLNITVQPTWLKKVKNISGMHTSAIVVFEDPDGTIERSLLKTAFFAFGQPITVRKWHNQPLIKS